MMPKSIAKKTAKRQASPAVTTPRIALYCRVSSDDQCDRKTIQSQVDFLRNWAHLYDFPICGAYADDGVSGTIPLEERPDGARLLADAQAGIFDAVVVYRVDRLARSLRVLLDGHNELEAVGVAIKSATEPFDSSTPLGKFLFQLLGSMAELERSTILERMTLGRDRVARQGRWTSGVLPFGYTLDAQHCLIPSQRLVDGLGMTEAEVARDIFDRMAAGSTTTKECQRLTALGVPHARRYRNGTEATVSSGWAPTRLTRMIRNSVYVGRHRFHSQQGLIERLVPALVDEQTWERAKAQLQKNRHLPKNGSNRRYLLSGLIQCVHCESYYTGSTKERIPGRPSVFYRCGGRVSKRYPHLRENCLGRQLKAAWLEDFVWDQCRAFIRNPGQALEEAQQQLQTRMAHGTRLEKERERLLQALAEQTSGREGVLTLFRRGRIALAEAETQLDALAKEEADIRAHLTALESQQHLADALKSHLTEASVMLTQLQTKLHAIEASNDQDAKRQIIEFLVAHIAVETDATVRPKQATATVTFRFSGEGAAYSTIHMNSELCCTLTRVYTTAAAAD